MMLAALLMLILLFLVLFVASSRQTYQPIRAAYVGIFDDNYEKMMEIYREIPWETFDRIYIAFSTLDQYGNMTDLTSNSKYQIKNITRLYRNANPNGEIFISSNYDGNMDGRYVVASEHPHQFATSVLKYLEQYQLDGYDMDWETGSINYYADKLILLLKSCKNIFNNKYKLTHTIFPSVHNETTVGAISNIVDGINIMCYAGWGNDLVNLIEAYHRNFFPYDKMFLGVESESGVDTYYTLKEKIGIICKYQLGGIYSWRLDNDYIASNEGLSFRMAKWIGELVNCRKD